MNKNTGAGISSGKVLVVVAIAVAVVFGVLLGYLAWSNDSFPTQQKPFESYGKVVSSNFNGTLYAFEVQWLSADSVPMYAQLTSQGSEAANSPVCDLGLDSVAVGQEIFMPFGVHPPEAALTNVDLSIAVKSVVNGTQFTITYHVDNVTAVPGNIQPPNLSCTEQNAPM